MIGIKCGPDEFLYLASPYTHDDPKVRHWRYEQALLACVQFAKEGLWTFSPIVHSHPMTAAEHDLPVPFNFWVPFDRAMIRSSAGVLVLMLEGWEASNGVKSEVMFAAEIKKSINYYGWLHRYEEAKDNASS